MARTSRVTNEQLEKARKKLVELPIKDNSKTTRETITTLSKDIQSALKKGYTLDDISRLLKDAGINVSGSTLKSYMCKKIDKNKSEKTSKDSEDKNLEEIHSEKSFVKSDLPDNDL